MSILRKLFTKVCRESDRLLNVVATKHRIFRESLQI